MRGSRIAEELTEATRIAHFRELEIHLVNAHEAPAVMEEIGTIREREFRAAGAGRGGAVDLDRYDTQWPWYSQLVSWDPEEGEIVAMYRAIHCGWALRHGGLSALRTAELFQFSDSFRREYLECAVELGRSVVNRSARRALAGLFSVWTGLGALTQEWRDIRWLFGNVSLYRSLPQEAIRGVAGFLLTEHRAPEGLVTAHHPVASRWIPGDGEGAAPGSRELPHTLDDLLAQAAQEGWEVPPILISYLRAHPGMLAFDIAEDGDFGGALEVAIAVAVEGITERTRQRFITPYVSSNPRRFILPDAPQ